MATTNSDLTPKAGTGDLFGHPKGLTFLFATEMWERFSYYGMRSLLVLYMVNHLLKPGAVENVAGYESIRAMLETVFGRLDVQALSSQIYGLYTGLVYLTPVFGGLLADRVLGQRRTVIVGAALMMVGHFLMAFESLFFVALAVLILGNGAFKPNIVTQVGDLYSSNDHRRDRAYAIFYVGINIGGFFAPLICGALGEELGWSYGFGAAGVGMLLGLLIYLSALRVLPPDQFQQIGRGHAGRTPLSRQERQIIAGLITIGMLQVLFWASYEQGGNTIVLWSNDYTDRSISLLGWQGQIPATWFLALNPFLIFTLTPPVVLLWAWQAKRGSEPSDVTKMAMGCMFLAGAYLILVVAAWSTGATGKAGWSWLFAFFVLLTVGELYLSPIGLALVAKVAPPSLRSIMMGLWLTTSFAGNFMAGWLGSFWSSMAKGEFFLMMAAISAVAAAAIWAVNRPLKSVLGE